MMFTSHEISFLDAPTADSDIILASLGGKPRMPGERSDHSSETASPGTEQSSGADIRQKEADSLSAIERGELTDGLRERRAATNQGLL